MSRNAKPSPWLRASAAAGGDAATFSPSAARNDAVALLRLAGLDAELDRLRQSVAAILADRDFMPSTLRPVPGTRP